jgi:hypothetical protein
MNLKLILFVGVCAIGFAISANAGTIADVDGDTIPDVFDDCSSIANGPTAGPNNQLDSDVVPDGFGNLCDGDFNNDGVVAGTDFGVFAFVFGIDCGATVGAPSDCRADVNGDGVVAGTDFGVWGGTMFGNLMGPSGLNCATQPGLSSCP